MGGEGPDRGRLEQMVEGLGLRPFFQFPGWVEKEKMREFFSQAQIFVFPKWWLEYGSVVLTEAMAFGLPCIIPGGGSLEWLAEKACFTFKDGDIEDLADKIEQLSNDNILRKILAKNSMKRAGELDYKVLTNKLNLVINSVISK